MALIGKYLVSVAAAAILCGIVTTLLGKKGTISAVIKLVCGIFLCFTVLRPWKSSGLADWTDFTGDIAADASGAVQRGETAAREAMAESIKSQTEAYILDKAAALEAVVRVEVTLMEGDPPLPGSVEIKGNISPYAKARLSQVLEEELGIPKEEQRWTG
ncbi:MAG TPA: hypothetical protein IAC31_00200 [Candidatus Faecousia intestinigallinarum]|nr:hypothetical protein [Candidatus Faecousia intestinigallinarum]